MFESSGRHRQALPGRSTAEEVIARARAIRDLLPKGKFTAKDIDAFKREGRP
jgi:antitoxin FitA